MKKLSNLHDKADVAIKKAVRNVIKQHKSSGQPLAVWKNGKTVLIYPDEITDF